MNNSDVHHFNQAYCQYEFIGGEWPMYPIRGV